MILDHLRLKKTKSKHARDQEKNATSNLTNKKKPSLQKTTMSETNL